MTRFRFLALSGILALTALCGNPGAEAPGTGGKAALTQAISKGALIVDVRTPEEFAGGHYANAINIPVDQVESRLADFGADKGRPIIVYCRSGNRSSMAQRILQQNGFAQVLNGINQANMP